MRLASLITDIADKSVAGKEEAMPGDPFTPSSSFLVKNDAHRALSWEGCLALCREQLCRLPSELWSSFTGSEP